MPGQGRAELIYRMTLANLKYAAYARCSSSCSMRLGIGPPLSREGYLRSYRQAWPAPGWRCPACPPASSAP